MKIIHDAFAVINIIGCLIGMFLMFFYYKNYVEFKKYEYIWNFIAFSCFAFCFVGLLREVYSLIHVPILGYGAWAFKFATSGIFIITCAFYKLITHFREVDKQLNDKD